MIARIVILLVLVLLLPQLYFDRRKLRRRKMWQRLLRWLPTVAMMVLTVALAMERDFVPHEMTVMNIYLMLLGLIFAPKAIYVLCSLAGRIVRKIRHSRYNWGNLVGFFLAFFIVFVVLYGSFVGVRRLNVNRLEIALKGLPEAFDGYRIVLFSDAHVGSFTGWRQSLLQRDIDSINAQQADAIFFVGDLQNQRPEELYPVQEMLRSLRATDGVFSVLGNHDYSDYIDDDPAIKIANEREMVSRQRQFGWKLLLNEHLTLEKQGARLVVAGVENDQTRKQMKKRNDLAKALEGVRDDDFIILLQHDPGAWQQTEWIQPQVSLTLSGHTHGGQVSLFGLRATQLSKNYDYGLYREGERQLYVTCGIGGLVPFRFGVTPEIAVITLKRINN
ncbi:MAG: metallophosphoesterase [Prevotella sp.]|nr:metallophosphoesterase [Prevotella sp.]